MKKIWFITAIVIMSGMAFAKSSTYYKASRYKYIGVFNAGGASQDMVETMGLEAMRTAIRNAWQHGKDIQEIKYGNGHWIGIFGKSDPKSHQTYVIASRWGAIDHIVEDYWKQGYFITNIEHGLDEWFVVFEKRSNFLNQAYERRGKRDDFVAAVHKRWKQGYDLVDIEYGEGHYVGIFVQRKQGYAQTLSIRSTWYDASRVIAAYWKKDYRIQNIEYTLGRWMILFSKSAHQVEQRFKTAHDILAFETLFKQQEKENYHLIDLSEGW